MMICLKMVSRLEKIILMNYWNVFVKYEPVNGEHIKKLQMYLNSVVMIMIKIAISQKLFMLLFKISFILQLPERQRQN